MILNRIHTTYTSMWSFQHSYFVYERVMASCSWRHSLFRENVGIGWFIGWVWHYISHPLSIMSNTNTSCKWAWRTHWMRSRRISNALTKQKNGFADHSVYWCWNTLGHTLRMCGKHKVWFNSINRWCTMSRMNLQMSDTRPVSFIVGTVLQVFESGRWMDIWTHPSIQCFEGWNTVPGNAKDTKVAAAPSSHYRLWFWCNIEWWW